MDDLRCSVGENQALMTSLCFFVGGGPPTHDQPTTNPPPANQEADSQQHQFNAPFQLAVYEDGDRKQISDEPHMAETLEVVCSSLLPVSFHRVLFISLATLRLELEHNA